LRGDVPDVVLAAHLDRSVVAIHARRHRLRQLARVTEATGVRRNPQRRSRTRPGTQLTLDFSGTLGLDHEGGNWLANFDAVIQTPEDDHESLNAFLPKASTRAVDEFLAPACPRCGDLVDGPRCGCGALTIGRGIGLEST
jgi:hypothetical protein